MPLNQAVASSQGGRYRWSESRMHSWSRTASSQRCVSSVSAPVFSWPG